MKLKGKLILSYILIAVLLQFILLLVMYSIGREATSKRSLELLSAIGDIQRSRMETIVEKRTESFNSFVRHLGDNKFAASYLQYRGPQEQIRTREYIQGFINPRHQFTEISLYDSRGNFLVATGNAQHHAIALKDEIHISLISSEQEKLFLSVEGPLILDEETVGYVHVHSDASPLIEILNDSSGMGESGKQLLVWQEKDQVHSICSVGRCEEIDKDREFNNIILQTAMGVPVAARHKGMESGAGYLAMAQQMDSTGWGILLVIDQAEVLGIFYSLLYINLLLTAGALILIYGIAYVIASSITRHTSLFTDASHKIAQGYLDVRIPSDRDDEIGELANAFNTMAQQMEDSHDQLHGVIKNLKEIDTMKDDFLHIAAHELKTPLTSIIGLSELIKRNNEGFNKSRKDQKYVDIIHEESSRLKRVVDQILTVTRYESGNEELRVERFDVVGFVRSLIPSFEPLALEKEVSIQLHNSCSECHIESDREKLAEILYNFVQNAIKYGPLHQTLTISISKVNEEAVKVAVHDQGVGIPKEMQKRLFAKFSQLENTLSRTHEGTGLGLYICKLIVEQLGGSIGLDSDEGEGTVFYVILPIRRASGENEIMEI